MSQFINQYFDFDFMAKHFDQVLSGFGTTMLLWVVSGVLALIWGLVLSLLRQTPGSAGLLSGSRRSPTSTPSGASRC